MMPCTSSGRWPHRTVTLRTATGVDVQAVLVFVVDTSLCKYTRCRVGYCLIGAIFLFLFGQGSGERLVDDAIESRKVERGDDRLTGWVKRYEREPRRFVFATGVRVE